MRPEDGLAARIAALPPRAPRHLVALAGPPAAGKSTLAAALVARLNAEGQGAVLVPMDGFHLDNSILQARGLLVRKGAPETFDAAGFVHAMGRLAREAEVILPDFDRAADISVAGRIAVGPAHRIAVVEGNYLVADVPVWRDLLPLWSLAVFVDVPDDALHARLVARWLAHGLSPEDADARARGNDMANATWIRRTRATGVEGIG